MSGEQIPLPIPVPPENGGSGQSSAQKSSQRVSSQIEKQLKPQKPPRKSRSFSWSKIIDFGGSGLVFWVWAEIIRIHDVLILLLLGGALTIFQVGPCHFLFGILKKGKVAFRFSLGIWIALVILTWIVIWHNSRPPLPPAVVITSADQWLPPELPPDCTNVIVWLGSSLELNISKTAAQMMSDSSRGQMVKIGDLPTNFVNFITTQSNYSPRNPNAFFRINYAVGGIFGSNIPAIPYVQSNRLFVHLIPPFAFKRRAFLFDSEMSNEIPRLWDWNCNSNKVEIVNEQTNPVIQIVYIHPNEAYVNGIFLVDAYRAYILYGQIHLPITLSASFTNGNTIQVVDLQEFIKSNIDFIPDMKFLYEQVYALGGQPFPVRPMFKYPSNIHFGELSKD